MALWHVLFPARSLEGVRSPTRARLRGVLAEGPSVESPVTGRRAPLIGWFLAKRYAHRPRRGLGERDGYAYLVGGLLAAPWAVVSVDGRLVRVATAALRVHIASSEWDGQLLHELPAFLVHTRANVHDPNLRYGERWLAPGDTVTLAATVTPVAEEASSPYRHGERASVPRAAFEARGKATIADTIGADLRVRLHA